MLLYENLFGVSFLLHMKIYNCEIKEFGELKD
jgi:hypothetical protein